MKKLLQICDNFCIRLGVRCNLVNDYIQDYGNNQCEQTCRQTIWQSAYILEVPANQSAGTVGYDTCPTDCRLLIQSCRIILLFLTGNEEVSQNWSCQRRCNCTQCVDKVCEEQLVECCSTQDSTQNTNSNNRS